MYKDIRKDKSNPVLYFRIVDHHRRLLGDDVSINSWQLMNLIKTEVPVGDYKKQIPDDCITHVKMGDFSISRLFEPTDVEKKHYPWVELAGSIEKLGLKIPIIAERLLMKWGGYAYRALECKHRLSASSMIRPFNLDRLIPCLVVEYDPKHTYECHVSGEPHLRTVQKREA